jgi:hypothetical protein
MNSVLSARELLIYSCIRGCPVKEEFAMEGTVLMLSEQDLHVQRMNLRRSVRAVVDFRMIAADKAGLAIGQVIDVTTWGCGLRLTKPLTRGQYLTLMVYPNDGTASAQCEVVQVQWVEEDRAGVAFLWMFLELNRRPWPRDGDRLAFEVED